MKLKAFCDFCGKKGNGGFVGNKGMYVVGAVGRGIHTEPFICKKCIIGFASTYGVRIKGKDGRCMPFRKA
jgi:hypothetical protein